MEIAKIQTQTEKAWISNVFTFFNGVLDPFIRYLLMFRIMFARSDVFFFLADLTINQPTSI